MNISLREKIFLIVGIVLITPIFIYRLMIAPLNTLNDNTEKNIKGLIRANSQIKYHQQEIQFYRSASGADNFQADAAIRNILTEMGLANDAQISSVAGAQNAKIYKIVLNEIRNDQLMSLLYRIEHNTPVMNITKLLVSRSFRDRNKKIKAELEIVS